MFFVGLLDDGEDDGLSWRREGQDKYNLAARMAENERNEAVTGCWRWDLELKVEQELELRGGGRAIIT